MKSPRPLILISALLTLALTGCATAPSGTTSAPDQASTAASTAAATSAPSPTPSASGLIDLDANDSWRAACVLPLTVVATIAGTIGMQIDHTDQIAYEDPECNYDTSSTTNLGSIGIQLREYDPTHSYGGLIAGSGSNATTSTWRAPTPAEGYAEACAAYKGSCDPSVGAGLVISGAKEEATIFLPGPYFYHITAYQTGGNDQVVPVLSGIASQLVTAPAPHL